VGGDAGRRDVGHQPFSVIARSKRDLSSHHVRGLDEYLTLRVEVTRRAGLGGRRVPPINEPASGTSPFAEAHYGISHDNL